VKNHFRDTCGYGADLCVGVVEAVKNAKKGRSFFPAVVDDFIRGSCQDRNKIYVLIVNMQLFTGNAKLLTRDDYDYGPEGFNCPLDGIKATKPVVMIDEPHRFDRMGKAYDVLSKKFCPQLMIRFGATFPEKTVGRGKQRKVIKDYENLLYNLDACASFNQGLIKGIAKEHLETPSRREEKLKITNIDSKETVHLQYKKKDSTPKSFPLKVGDSLSVINEELAGLTVAEIDTSSITFSNGVTKKKGEEMEADVCMTSYQEQMLNLALQRHFETERVNFSERQIKIKTLALFFIDDITSYRSTDGEEAYLLTAFEQALRQQINELLPKLREDEAEYKEYLQATLADIAACHAGYFAKDNEDSDEKIAEEVNVILHGKKELLEFKKPDGKWNTLRFLFSKWTLKEGWDNPNVFTIAKLRSSGSEISKLQEVGRGLRLPVDETGNRVANESFELNYIVDFTEADFADKLVAEINAEVPEALVLTEENIVTMANRRSIDKNALVMELMQKGYINYNLSIVPEKRHQFFDDYPDFNSGVQPGKINDRNKKQKQEIKIRKGVFGELSALWQAINERYVLLYKSDLDDELQDAIYKIFKDKDVFRDEYFTSRRDRVAVNEEQAHVEDGSNVSYRVNKILPYGVFLQRISRATSLSIKDLHSALSRLVRESSDKTFLQRLNDSTVAAFCGAFNDWKNESLQGRFSYRKTAVQGRGTSLTDANGNPKKVIAQGLIGDRISEGTPSDKYLYDAFAYDSPLELQNMRDEITSVTVYGKIPKRSMAIPTVAGGTYSPDFMYVVQHSDGTKVLNIIVETKDVDDESDLRGVEQVKIDCAKKFFENLTVDGYKVHFETQINNKKVKQIIEDIMKDNV